ncbi:MAG: hypothetical protein ACU0DI_13720, partial [Paracoccaceae bacterium]
MIRPSTCAVCFRVSPSWVLIDLTAEAVVKAPPLVLHRITADGDPLYRITDGASLFCPSETSSKPGRANLWTAADSGLLGAGKQPA